MHLGCFKRLHPGIKLDVIFENRIQDLSRHRTWKHVISALYISWLAHPADLPLNTDCRVTWRS